MAAGVEIDEVVRVMKTRAGTRTKNILAAFRQYGIESKSTRLLRNNGLPNFAIVKMRFKDDDAHWMRLSH